MLAAEHTLTQIAAELGVDKSTISRERRRHATHRGLYRPLQAQARAEAVARASHARPRKLSQPGPLRRYVVAGLKQKWSPQEISSRLRREHPDDPVMRVSAETIYQSLFVQARGSLKKELTAHLRTERTRRHSQTARVEAAACGRGRLPGTISIRERPAEVEDRAVPGHWEGDLIIGANNALRDRHAGRTLHPLRDADPPARTPHRRGVLPAR